MRGPVTPLWNHQSGSIWTGQQERKAVSWPPATCLYTHCTHLYCIVLYTCNVMYCTHLYCTVLYCNVMYSTQDDRQPLLACLYTWPPARLTDWVVSWSSRRNKYQEIWSNRPKKHSDKHHIHRIKSISRSVLRRLHVLTMKVLNSIYFPVSIGHLTWGCLGCSRDQTPGSGGDSEASGQPQPIMCTRDPTPDIGPELPCVTQSVLWTLESDIFLELRQWLDIEREET